MLKILLKKQIAEVFKSYFYDAKRNRMRSKGAIAAYIVLFIIIMVGLLGGIFTGLSLSMCSGLVSAGMGWMYFLMMSIIAILIGAFGSVFNSYSSLYLSKDNDLLLALPIPVRTIMAARLLNVYLMGAMYSATVMIPALIVYWFVTGAAMQQIICGILLLLIETVIVMLLSCLLGWVVAKISLKLKNKSFITVLISLVCVGLYYLIYFKANTLINTILLNAESYGEKIRGISYGFYLFGRVGEGDWLATVIYTGVTALLFVIVWSAVTRSFLRIATSGGSTKKVRYVEKPVREKSTSGALLGKEFARFSTSPSYMLNCGIGILFIPVSGVLLLVRGREICEMLNEALTGRPDSAAIMVCTMLCMLVSMNDIAAPSISLEGKNLWILQSLPVSAKTVLRAKASVQMILTGIPLLFAVICAAVAVPASWTVRILICVMPLIYALFSALYGMMIGVKMPILNWTNEIAPIKQSGAVTIVLFSSWGFSILLAGIYLLIGYRAGAALYLLFWAFLYAVASLLLLHWLDTKGSRDLAGM